MRGMRAAARIGCIRSKREERQIERSDIRPSHGTFPANNSEILQEHVSHCSPRPTHHQPWSAGLVSIRERDFCVTACENITRDGVGNGHFVVLLCLGEVSSE